MLGGGGGVTPYNGLYGRLHPEGVPVPYSGFRYIKGRDLCNLWLYFFNLLSATWKWQETSCFKSIPWLPAIWKGYLFSLKDIREGYNFWQNGYKRVRGKSSGRSLPLQNSFGYPFWVTVHWITSLCAAVLLSRIFWGDWIFDFLGYWNTCLCPCWLNGTIV